MSQVQPNTAKAALQVLCQSLPDNVTWDEIQYHVFVRQQIELGLADSAAGRVMETAEVEQRWREQRRPPVEP